MVTCIWRRRVIMSAERLLAKAKLAERAERYEDMAKVLMEECTLSS